MPTLPKKKPPRVTVSARVDKSLLDQLEALTSEDRTLSMVVEAMLLLGLDAFHRLEKEERGW